MLDMFLKSFIIATIGGTLVYADCGKCSVPKHYEELNCKPIKKTPDDCCASSYECPDFSAMDKTKCHHLGKSYAVGFSTNESLPTCTKTCTCGGEGEETGFACSFEDCKESAEEPAPDVTLQFTIDSCCATEIVRGKEAIDKLARCFSDGHEYVQGNLIYSPNSPCYKCLCDDNYNNATDPAVSPSCKKVDCGIEIHQLGYIQNGGVPVYLSNGFCCPFEFRNQKENDVLVRAANPTPNASDIGTCKYGKITMAIGDTITTEDPCLTCACTIPPLAQCTRTINTEKCA